MISRRNSESGYAMLLVFAMSAIIAITLYQQLPRAAFEAQREKESLLIDHGEQYRRGVQLYVRKMGRYPAKMEDLDNTQSIRFLRKHYIDPMTGKDEWRLLHMGPAGKLIDSKIETANANADLFKQGSITEFKAAGSSDIGPEAINLGARKRPSDDLVLGPINGTPTGAPRSTDPPPLGGSNTAANLSASLNAGMNMGTPGGTNANAPGTPTTPGAVQAPPIPAWVNGGALPGMPPGQRGTTAPTAPVFAPPANSGASSSISGNGGFGASISGNGGYGAPAPVGNNTPASLASQTGGQTGGFVQGAVNSQYQGQVPTPNGAPSQYPTGFQQPGLQGSPAQMINSLLTSPRPGGAPAGVGQPGMGGSIVGGLAGVASNYKGHGIKRYGDQDEYQKWEFFYDFAGEMRGATQGISPNTLQNNNPNNQPNSNSNSSFGGNNSSFGNFGNGATPASQPQVGMPIQRPQ